MIELNNEEVWRVNESLIATSQWGSMTNRTNKYSVPPGSYGYISYNGLTIFIN